LTHIALATPPRVPGSTLLALLRWSTYPTVPTQVPAMAWRAIRWHLDLGLGLRRVQHDVDFWW